MSLNNKGERFIKRLKLIWKKLEILKLESEEENLAKTIKQLEDIKE